MKINTINNELIRLFGEPFPAESVGWKPQSVKGDRCLAIAYIDARNVQDRLDKTVGPLNWKAEYHQIGEHSVVCVLSVRVEGGDWVSKSDVGATSDQPDQGDRLKAAFSDALKRAGVHWGIGRYLYELPLAWVAYDSAKRTITTPPALPDWALPTVRLNSVQEAELSRLIKESCTPIEAVLDHYRIHDLLQLPQAKYDQVKAHLTKKLAERQERDRAAKPAPVKA